MHIDTDLLYTWGAIAKKVPKHTVIFFENDPPLSYYQILEGTVKMSYTNEDGKDLKGLIQNTIHQLGEN